MVPLKTLSANISGLRGEAEACQPGWPTRLQGHTPVGMTWLQLWCPPTKCHINPTSKKQVRRILPSFLLFSWAQTPSLGLQHHCTLVPLQFNPVPSLFPTETWGQLPGAPSQHPLASTWTCLLPLSQIFPLARRCHQSKFRAWGSGEMSHPGLPSRASGHQGDKRAATLPIGTCCQIRWWAAWPAPLVLSWHVF